MTGLRTWGALVLSLAVLLLAGCGGETETIVYRVPFAPEAAVQRSADILEERADALGVDVKVKLAGEGGERRIEVTVPSDDASRVEQQLGSPASLGVYDWERNVIAPPGASHPSEQPFMRPYDAAVFASRRAPECSDDRCSAAGPTYYLFDRQSKKLLAGPAVTRSDLVGGQDATPDREVVSVPQGTLVIREQAAPDDPATEENESDAIARGWFVIRDRPDLTDVDVAGAERTFEPVANQPAVSVDFTAEGARRFEALTARLAERSARRIEQLDTGYQHFAFVLDGEVLLRPILDPSQSPDGINGEKGILIIGNFTVQEAQDLALFLDIGSLPLRLIPVEGG